MHNIVLILRVSILRRHHHFSYLKGTNQTMEREIVYFEDLDTTHRLGLARYEEFSTEEKSGVLECYPKHSNDRIKEVVFQDEVELTTFCTEYSLSLRLYTVVNYGQTRKTFEEIRKLIDDNVYSVDNMVEVCMTKQRKLIEFEHINPSLSSSFVANKGKQAKFITDVFKSKVQFITSGGHGKGKVDA